VENLLLCEKLVISVNFTNNNNDNNENTNYNYDSFKEFMNLNKDLAKRWLDDNVNKNSDELVASTNGSSTSENTSLPSFASAAKAKYPSQHKGSISSGYV